MKQSVKALYGCLIILSVHSSSAQGLRLCGHFGFSSYGAVALGGLGTGGGSDQEWKRGWIVGIGVQVPQSEHFSLNGLLEFSSHEFQSTSGSPIPVNDPRNSILELSWIGKFRISIVDPVALSLFPGISVYYQHKDERVYSNPGIHSQEESRFGVAGVIGAGLSLRCSEKVDVYVDGSWRMRAYVTPVVVLGIAYDIN